MRKFIDGNGAVSTSHADRVAQGNGALPDVLTYMAANRHLTLADLYVINTAPQYAGQYLGQQFLLTDYPAPLKWNYRGTFKTADISRGEVKSKIGLEADTLQINWSPQASDVLATDSGGNPLLTVLQAFRAGIFDNGTIEVWRCIMPTPGDCNTLGACCMFGARMGDVESDSLTAQITALSRLELLDVQVPLALIEPGNILAQYSPGILPTGAPPSLTMAAGSTANKIYADAAGSTPSADLYEGGYLIITSGKLAGHYVDIESQDVEGAHWTFYLQIPLPFAPASGDTIAGYIAVPVDYETAKASPGGYAGWPNVPVPIDSAMLIG